MTGCIIGDEGFWSFAFGVSVGVLFCAAYLSAYVRRRPR